ncbi:MAG: SUMF1/EgtB/PvdO family nonheme iron enzyme [Phycisphaerales bacterium]
MPARLPSSTLAALALGAAATLGHAQTVPPGPPPDWGHDFVTIGAPGNRGVLPFEAPRWDFDRFGTYGDVAYEYRITRTEVTNTQYLEFLNVYTKLPGRTSRPGIFGRGILAVGFDPSGNPILVLQPGAAQAPADPSWEYAARYTNWLHNGKGTRLEDFETGVYDTSTFREDPVTGERMDQLERSPGSRFFLPSFDEWIKAAHYDPNKNGPGVPPEERAGYWYHPGGSDDYLVSGPPGTPGAETGAGERPPDFLYFPVGQYPGTSGPWGLLDTSGGAQEWTETVIDPSIPGRLRVQAGSSTGSSGYMFDDRIDTAFLGRDEPSGFRVASVVPAPGTAVLLSAGLGSVCFRRRR